MIGYETSSIENAAFGMTSAHFLLLVLAAGLGLAAWSDLRRFVIPNAVVGLVSIGGLVWALFEGEGLAAHLAIGAAALVVGFMLYHWGIFGAGDAKLAAAVLLFAGPAQALPVVLHTAVIGGIFTFLWIGSRPLRLVLGGLGMDVDPTPPNTIPYGVAIAGAGLALIARQWPV